MSASRVTVVLACRIAGINRDRFNEAVHAGYYPCAPATAKGSRRLFDEDDLIALYAYAYLLDEGFPAYAAGELACRVLNQARDYPDAALVFTVWGDDGGQETISAKEADMKIVSGKSSGRPDGSRALAVVYRAFDIGNIRKIIRNKIREESNILGDDGE